MTKRLNVVLWTIQGLLGLLFLFSGSAKLFLPIAELTRQLPLAGWLVRFLGVAELLGSAGLVLPGLLRIRPMLTPLAAAGLALIMSGATVANLLYAGVGAAVATLPVGCALGFIAWKRLAAAPESFRVERTQNINVAPEQIFGHIADFHAWAGWSPFEKLDPAMKRTFSGAGSGKGAVYEWAGNSKAGAGRMEILEANQPSRIAIKLDFLKPFEGHNTAVFTLRSKDGATDVTWAMYGPQKLLCKLMSAFFDMDRMIGREFAAGLANLKNMVENQVEVGDARGELQCR